MIKNDKKKIYNILLIRECTWTYNGSCYYLSDHKEEFFAAESECAVKYAGHLVSKY